ncbi:hypothetical protein [Kribbella deserti]|uniref:DUF2157 domain-containing protein n=1 Tax=Kribbella deserti TaxID=1926257 RepID=A0ABV6QD22_9ACTN
MTSRLDDELRRLVGAGVLRIYQADALRAAAEADAAAARAEAVAGQTPLGRSDRLERPDSGAGSSNRSGRPSRLERLEPPNGGQSREEPVRRTQAVDRRKGSALIEILGYIGGVLLLGAVGLLTVANWSLMGRASRISTAVVSAVVLLAAAAVVAYLRDRAQPSSALAALGACTAGFATSVIIPDAPGRVIGVVVALVTAGLGLWLLRGTSLLVATFAILSVGVFELVFDVIDTTGGRSDTAGLAGVGFIVVAGILAALGQVRDRVTAWSLSGAAAFSSSMCWLVQDRGELMALAVGTAGSAALLLAYARHRAPAYVVAGCSILLVVWPTSLYRLTGNVAGVAIGLLIASSALIATVIVLARRAR